MEQGISNPMQEVLARQRLRGSTGYPYALCRYRPDCMLANLISHGTAIFVVGILTCCSLIKS